MLLFFRRSTSLKISGARFSEWQTENKKERDVWKGKKMHSETCRLPLLRKIALTICLLTILLYNIRVFLDVSPKFYVNVVYTQIALFTPQWSLKLYQPYNYSWWSSIYACCVPQGTGCQYHQTFHRHVYLIIISNCFLFLWWWNICGTLWGSL